VYPFRSTLADDRRARLNKRLREAFIAGAEEDSRRRLGRGLMVEEMSAGGRHDPGYCGAREQ
jgi:hypothetical protein